MATSAYTVPANEIPPRARTLPRLTQSASDQDGLLPLLDATAANTGRLPDEVLADNGFCSKANLAGLVERGLRGYVATGRAKRPAAGKSNAGPLTVAVHRRLRQGGHRSRYRARKHIVEPVFGQIKAARGFWQLLLRGVEKVTGEWALICTAQPRKAHRMSGAETRAPKPSRDGTSQPLQGHAPSPRDS